MKGIDLLNKTFGRLTVIEFNGINENGKYLWKCKCVCGNFKTILSQRLLNSASTSCGCLHKEQLINRLTKHGFTPYNIRPPSEYSIWSNMKQRCFNKKSNNYKYYGGRGISVCDIWVNDFVKFMTDMGARPSNQHSIDRIDNNGNYEPNNCKWATKSEQSINRRNVNLYEHNNMIKTVSDWNRHFNLSPCTLQSYLKNHTFQEAIEKYEPK